MIHFKVDIYKIFASIPSEEKIKKENKNKVITTNMQENRKIFICLLIEFLPCTHF